MKNNFEIVTSTLLMVFVSHLLLAQNDSTGWGRNSRFNRMYDTKTVTEIEGQITKVEEMSPMRGTSPGVHITVKSETDTFSVHVGPKWYLEKQSVTLNENDRIAVKGSRVTIQGEPTIIAAKITKGNAVIELRNDNGVPVWAGRGRR